MCECSSQGYTLPARNLRSDSNNRSSQCLQTDVSHHIFGHNSVVLVTGIGRPARVNTYFRFGTFGTCILPTKYQAFII